jgi:hypothetical protein
MDNVCIPLWGLATRVKFDEGIDPQVADPRGKLSLAGDNSSVSQALGLNAESTSS